MYLLKLAWRDLRGSGQSLWVLCACLVLGVTLIAATGGLYQQILQGLKADSREISGGDLQVESRSKLPNDVIKWISDRGQISLLIELDTMMATSSGRFQLVEVQSVDQHYPLYGSLTLDPPLPLDQITRHKDGRFGLAMDPVLAERLNLDVGDMVEIGVLELEIRALITHQPDRSLTANWRGSPVMISEAALDQAGLIFPGSRVEYEYRVRTEMDLDSWQRALFESFPGTDWEVSTFLDRSDRIGERLAQAGSALLIIGFSTLFIGGLGVFNSVQAYLQSKLGTIATLRSVGLRDTALAKVYLTQILIMSGLSCVLGAGLGFLVSLLSASFVETQVQLDTLTHSALVPSALAAVFGLITAMTFAAPAIGRALSVDPAVLFRSLDGVKTSTPKAWWVATFSGATCVVLIVIIALPDPLFAAAFIGTILGLLVLLEGLVRLIRSFAATIDQQPARKKHFALHLALANLHQQSSALRATLLTLGASLTLLVSCTVLVTTLFETIADTIPEESPDLVLYDVSPDQYQSVTEILKRRDASRIDLVPLVQGRLNSINAQSLDASDDLETQREARDEHKLTYRAGNVDGVTMVEGDWWPTESKEAWVVMEDREANQIGVEIGDLLEFDVAGQSFEAKLSGIFKQQGLQTRFWFEAIVSDGALDPFVSRYVGASFMPEEGAIKAQQEIAELAPNIVSVRTAMIVATAKQLLGQAVAGIAVVSIVAFSVSMLVLAGVMASHRSRQVYYSTILHTIGARLSVIRFSVSMEYVLLALVTSIFALVLGILIALPVLHFQLKLPLTFPIWPPIVAAIGVSSVSLYTGAAYLMRRLKLKPATLLKGQ